MFNRQFNGAVHEQIRREQEFEEFDLNGFLESIDDGNCVNNPREERKTNQEYQPPQVRETATSEALWDREELGKCLTGDRPASLSPTWEQDFRF